MHHAFFFKPPVEDNYLGHQLSEIYRDQIFLPLLQGKQNLTIVDCGANIGMTAYYFSRFAKVVHAIEPSLEHFEVLTKMIEYNKLDNVLAHKLAIYIKEGDFPQYHNHNRTMRSLHTAVNDNTEQPEQVHAVPLDKFFKDNKIEHCDLLKVDIEGSEIEVFSSQGFKEIADKIDTIVTEYHQWSGRPLSQLIDALQLRGFKIEQIPSTAEIIVAKRV